MFFISMVNNFLLVSILPTFILKIPPLFSWILFSVLVAVNLLRLAGDCLLQRVRGRPQDVDNPEPVVPQV